MMTPLWYYNRKCKWRLSLHKNVHDVTVICSPKHHTFSYLINYFVVNVWNNNRIMTMTIKKNVVNQNMYHCVCIEEAGDKLWLWNVVFFNIEISISSARLSPTLSGLCLWLFTNKSNDVSNVVVVCKTVTEQNNSILMFQIIVS